LPEKNVAYGERRENEEAAGARAESWWRPLAQVGYSVVD